MKVPSLFAILCCGFLMTSCGGGGGGGDHQIPPVTPTINVPGAPGPVNATVSSGAVTLSWQRVTSADYYNIYYRDTPGVTQQNGIRISNVSPPETVSGLTDGQPYYFVVTGVNARGEGSASAEVEATPALQRTKIVGGLYATPGAGEATIEWDSQTEASSYNLYWWTDLPNQKTQIADVTSPYVMGGLEYGTTYHFEVAAANALGEGQHSPGTHATPVDPASGWTPQIRVTFRHFHQSGGQSEGDRGQRPGLSSNDDGIVAVAASVCSGRCSIKSVVIYHNAEGDWVGPINVEYGVQTLRPKVIVTPAGHILVAYERDGRGIYTRRYRNGVWEDSVRIDSRGFQYFRAWVDLASDEAGNIFAVWMEAIDLVPNDRNSQVQQVWASRYDAANDIWSSPTMLAESVRGVVRPSISIDMSENNQAIAAWLQDTQAYDQNQLDGGPEYPVVYASSFDGTDWSVGTLIGSSPATGNDSAWELGLDMNDAGSALVTAAVTRIPGDGSQLRHIEAIRFDGQTRQWDTPVLLDNIWTHWTRPVAQIDNSNRAMAAWAGINGLMSSEYDPAAATWGLPAQILDHGATGELRIDTDDAGRTIAVWNRQDSADGIYTSSSDDARATWSPVSSLGAHANVFQVSTRPNGSTVVAASSGQTAHDGIFWGTESAIYISTYTPPP